MNPHQWSLAKQIEKICHKSAKQTEAKMAGVIKPQNYNYNKFQHGKF